MSQQEKKNTKKIYVGSLPYETTSEDLVAMFSRHGAVEAADVICDRESGRSKGFGFVSMDADSAENAIQALHGTTLLGRKLVVNEARPQEPRRSSGSGFGGERSGGFRGGFDRPRRF